MKTIEQNALWQPFDVVLFYANNHLYRQIISDYTYFFLKSAWSFI